MQPWFFHPFPLPFPAPSAVGFLTAYAMLVVPFFFLGTVFPKVLFLVFRTTYFSRKTWIWATLLLCVSLVGQGILHFYSTPDDLTIGLVWGAISLVSYAALRHGLSFLY